MKILHTIPKEDGFYMPAEFEEHYGCIMIWPERADSWQYGAVAARKAFCEVAKAIGESEKGIIVVTKDLESGGGYAGVPAKKIGSFEELLKKRRQLPFNNVSSAWEEFSRR